MNFANATIDDINELTQMRIAYIKDEQGFVEAHVEQTMLEKLPGYFLEHLGKDLIAFVAKDNLEIIATAFLLAIEKPNSPSFINGTTGSVMNVYTLPKYRKKGIATQLIHNLIEYAKENEYDFVELKATDEGYPLYKKIGFKEYDSEYTDMRFFL